MRKVTQNIVGVLSLGVLATSWSLGQAAESGLTIKNTASTDTTSASPTPEPSSSSSASSAATPDPAASSSASAAATPTPTATKTAAPSSSAASVTKKSDPISYVAERRTGTMQISVTKPGSKITAVNIKAFLVY